ncbi:MAG TPA: diguanylate cyclase [Rhodocyclaceae bacterium]|nr:diguanylate cyclase [Rhodocyclaceae bacterium]
MKTFISGNKRLMPAIALFVVLDFGTLAFGYRIAKQVEKDAVAINLAGRQRMLSQRTTKAVLIATNEKTPDSQRRSAVNEANAAYALFLQTLHAFADGGKAQGGSGKSVMLDQVQGKAREPIDKVLLLVDSYAHLPNDPKSLQDFSNFLVANNQSILDSMNQLTSALETQSVDVIGKLRIVQTLAFILSLVNFGAILMGMHRDRKAAELSSITDILTGLLNRTGIYRKLDHQILIAREKRESIGVLLLDLNGFKAINDQFGHAIGDKALVEVSQKLQDWCPPNWSPGRLGGDEFVIICPKLHPKVLEKYAHELTRYLRRVEVIEGAFVSASVGWASSPPETTPDQLMSAADAMMYSEKVEHHKVRRYRESSRSSASEAESG